MNSFKKIKSLKGFKSLSFYSRDEQEILEALRLLSELDYRTVDGCFNTADAVSHNGLCAWSDGEITEGWLVSNAGFTQVTLAELKEMVGEGKEVLWLNIETLEEMVINDGKKFYSDVWVKVPEGATFATGDKDDYVFRKDGWYYEQGEWVKGNVTIKNLHTHEFVKLFWVKGGVKGDMFTLERLLGCEVKINYSGVTGYVTDIIDNGLCLHICCGGSFDVVSKYYLTFFTEDGDKLTFDEYVKMYYGGGV